MIGDGNLISAYSSGERCGRRISVTRWSPYRRYSSVRPEQVWALLSPTRCCSLSFSRVAHRRNIARTRCMTLLSYLKIEATLVWYHYFFPRGLGCSCNRVTGFDSPILGLERETISHVGQTTILLTQILACCCEMLRRICVSQIQRRKHALDHADCTAPTRQHELDHTDQEIISLKSLGHASGK